MLGKAIWRHRIQENPSAAGVRPTPLGELTALPQNPQAGGEELAAPSPKTHPRSRPFGPRLSYPHSKISSNTLVENQWCNQDFFQDQDQDLNFKTKTKTKTLKFFQDQDQDQDQA